MGTTADKLRNKAIAERLNINLLLCCFTPAPSTYLMLSQLRTDRL